MIARDITRLFRVLHNMDRQDLERSGVLLPGQSGDSAWKRFNSDLTTFVLKMSEPETQLFANLLAEKMGGAGSMSAAGPDLLREAKSQLDWLLHIKPQVTAPFSVMLGFDQAIKHLRKAISKAEGGAE